ncbi:MAG: GNAT family N-acetyltransferase [Actinomycetota bacterium]|nr:GNAT family N-acetyltransferase [Actinomycetota bacterium]
MAVRKKIKIISSEGNITLRSIEKEDIELIRKWRNENRRYFFYKEEIDAGQQEEWFKSYKNNGKENIFIVEFEGLKVGCIGFRFINNTIDVYNVILGDKKFGGRGIMGRALKLMCGYIIDNYDGEITLMVLPENNKARQWYIKNGFEEAGREKEYIPMKLNINKFNYLKYNLEDN